MSTTSRVSLVYSQSGAEEPRQQEVSYCQLGDWLRQQGVFKKDEETSRSNFKGGLRLLFQPWHFGLKSPAAVQKTRVVKSKNCTCLPLKSSSTFTSIIDNFKLPRSYPHDLAHRHHVPVRLSRIPNGIQTTLVTALVLHNTRTHR
jgi:hypothetical protein